MTSYKLLETKDTSYYNYTSEVWFHFYELDLYLCIRADFIKYILYFDSLLHQLRTIFIKNKINYNRYCTQRLYKG